MLSFLADFEEFCEQHLVQSVGRWAGEPFLLEDFQREFFREALSASKQGDYEWERVTLILSRKNGKTTMLSAYAVWRLLTDDDSPEILLAATSDKQAGRLFNACAAFIRRSSALSALCRIRDHAGEIVREDGEGIVYRMSSDPARLQGYNPSLVIADEVGEWSKPNLKRAWVALTTGGGARRPQVFTITTAGSAEERHDGILGGILDTALERGEVEETPGRTICRLPEAKSLVWNYEAPTRDRFDIPALKLANPASWITEEYLSEQAHSDLRDSAFLRYHGCVWAAMEGHWLPAGAWEDRAEPRTVEDGEQIVVGFDGSYNRDTTALVGCTLDGHLFVIRLWERPDDDHGSWVVPRDQVHGEVERTMSRFHVVRFAVDRAKWYDETEEWGSRYGSPPVVEFKQTRAHMVAACSTFYAAVVQGELTHDGDPRLAAHLSHATVKETADGAYITKESRDSPRKIDLAVAAVMAYESAVSVNDQGAWFEPEILVAV